MTRNPNVDDFIGKDQQIVIDWLARQGLDQIVEVFKNMFPRFQAFSHCLSSYNTEACPKKIVVIMYFAFKTYATMELTDALVVPTFEYV